MSTFTLGLAANTYFHTIILIPPLAAPTSLKASVHDDYTVVDTVHISVININVQLR